MLIFVAHGSLSFLSCCQLVIKTEQNLKNQCNFEKYLFCVFQNLRFQNKLRTDRHEPLRFDPANRPVYRAYSSHIVTKFNQLFICKFEIKYL